MKANLIIAIWLYIALLPIERLIFGYRSVRDQIVTRQWSIDLSPAIDGLSQVTVGVVSVILMVVLSPVMAIA